jgi:hypothetical protein
MKTFREGVMVKKKDARKKNIRLVKNETLEKPITTAKQKPKRRQKRTPGREPIKWEVLVEGLFGPILADRSSPFELKMKLVAAYKSYEAHIKSVDYTLKRYGIGWENELIKGCWDEDEYEEKNGRILPKQI